ncbi:MAG: GNAT family N-acetyltransferase, partial [Desulfuromonadaceae bacterium]|nr:GNAT family N-acetyltransferase [Desulfuromonadaceae bacterium]
CPFIAFEPGLTTAAHRATMSRNMRREFSNVANRLQKVGVCRLRCQVLGKDNTLLLERLCEIERQSAKASRNIHLVFSPEQNNMFQRCLLEQANETVQPLLTTLELEEEIIAYLYGFVVGGIYHAYNTAFLPDYARFSPGKLTIQETIDHCIFEKMREFDFLRGNSYIKSKWSSTVRPQYHLTLMEQSLLNQLHGRLIFTVRPRVKQLLGNFRQIVPLRPVR